MFTQTFIIEKKDFGEAQQAYDNFPEVQNRFYAQVNDYQSIINDISSQDISLLNDNEMHAVDSLAKDVELSLEQYKFYYEILIKYFDKTMTECEQLKKRMSFQNSSFIQNADVSYSLNLINEAIALKNNNSIIEALDKITEAKECLLTAYNGIMLEWFITHQQFLSGLKDLTETKKMGVSKNGCKMLIS